MTGRRALLLLLALGLTVRLAAALVFGLGGPPQGDERGYVLLAQSVAAGDGFELPVAEETLATAGLDAAPPRTAYRAPLWPLVLAPFASGPLSGLRWVALVLGALGAPLLWRALRDGPLPPRLAFAAAAVYAVWPPTVWLSLRALSEPLALVLILGAIAALPRAGASAPGRAAALAGGLAALAVLAKPALLPAAVALGLIRGKRPALVFLGIFLLVLAPWVVRNAHLHGRPLLTTNSGVTLVGSNSVAAAAAPSPGKWLPPDAVYAGRADPPDLWMWGWSELGEEASDRRFTREALDWIAENPGSAGRLAVWKVVRLFDPDPRSAQGDAPLKRWIGWLTLTPVLLLALLSVPAVRARWRAHLPWLALLAGTVAVAVLFYGDTRMRSAADPALLVLAVGGGAGVLRRVRGVRNS